MVTFAGRAVADECRRFHRVAPSERSGNSLVMKESMRICGVLRALGIVAVIFLDDTAAEADSADSSHEP